MKKSTKGSLFLLGMGSVLDLGGVQRTYAVYKRRYKTPKRTTMTTTNRIETYHGARPSSPIRGGEAPLGAQ